MLSSYLIPGPLTHAKRPFCAVVILATVSSGCADGSKAVLSQQAEAHRLASHLHVQFARAADASNRAVMADTDDASAAAAKEAQQATSVVAQDIDSLARILGDLGDRDEARELEVFKGRFAQYRALDADILPLAVENTNIKAQRLSFGPAQEAVDTFKQSLETAVKLAPAKNASAAAASAAQAVGATLEIQVIEARHIAESDDAAMTRMEAVMKTSETSARTSLQTLKGLLPPAASQPLAAAAAALDRLMKTNTEIVTLSRRNSNVRSLALSLGKKRALTAQCDESLQALEDALAAHHFSATR
jgi:hypothetical protein